MPRQYVVKWTNREHWTADLRDADYHLSQAAHAHGYAALYRVNPDGSQTLVEEKSEND